MEVDSSFQCHSFISGCTIHITVSLNEPFGDDPMDSHWELRRMNLEKHKAFQHEFLHTVTLCHDSAEALFGTNDMVRMEKYSACEFYVKLYMTVRFHPCPWPFGSKGPLSGWLTHRPQRYHW